MSLPDPVLSATDRAHSAASIAATQQSCGTLPWPDGHTDVWDHIESAMALVLGGQMDGARAAYDWLKRTQAQDGTWATRWNQEVVLDAGVDINQCAYVAVGVWQWWLVRHDRTFIEQMWPAVRAALDAVLRMQAPEGHVFWSREPSGEIRREALLTGSSSMYQSLRCGIALAELVGDQQPDWELAAGRLQHAVAHHTELFLNKSRFSMDWYYPVLGGCIRGQAGRALLASRWKDFVIAGKGVRCVHDQPWVTGAESAELALSLVTLGEFAPASAVLRDVQHLRHQDGSYWTGLVISDDVRWPAERSCWTAAAMVLAADALAGGPSRGLFTGQSLPTGMLLGKAACLAPESPCRGSLHR